MRYGGDLAIGAYGLVNRVLTLFIMIEIGVTQGMQPVIGFNYGALLFDRVRKTLRYALIAGFSIMTFGFLLSQLFPSAIVGMLSRTFFNLSGKLKSPYFCLFPDNYYF